MRKKSITTKETDLFKVNKKYHDLPLHKKYIFLQHVIDWAEGQQIKISEEFVAKTYEAPKKL